MKLKMSSEISQNYGKENYVENLSASVLPCFILCLKIVPMALHEKRMVAGYNAAWKDCIHKSPMYFGTDY